MPSVHSVELSAEAELDLVDVLRYSRREWGQARGDAYYADLEHAIDRLAVFPFSGARLDRVVNGRRLIVGRHVIVYLVEASAVVVLRVLHQRMDIERHVP